MKFYIGNVRGRNKYFEKLDRVFPDRSWSGLEGSDSNRTPPKGG
jgi:hypothetical protein